MKKNMSKKTNRKSGIEGLPVYPRNIPMLNNPKPIKREEIRAWAIFSNGGVLIGGGTKFIGYTPLCVYSTRIGAKLHLSKTRPKDKIIPILITPLKSKKK